MKQHLAQTSALGWIFPRVKASSPSMLLLESKATRQVRPAWSFSRSALTDAKGACLLFARSRHGRWRECQCHHRRGRRTATNPLPVVRDAVPTSVFSLRRLIRVHQQRADAASDGLIDFSVRLRGLTADALRPPHWLLSKRGRRCSCRRCRRDNNLTRTRRRSHSQ